ncbi:MAG: Smr/MutS family protein [Deltaproteobacteria bacterium]|nr:Smr/MutS family protein [Deltaproteobacteria bacterium]
MKDKPPRQSATYRPFENLRSLLQGRILPKASSKIRARTSKRRPHGQFDHTEEQRLFEEAMAGVVPLEREDSPPIDEQPPSPLKRPHHPSEAAEALARLEDLVERGKGFVVSDTPEYMEGIGYGVNPEVATRLHRGDFSIQGHLDLHGLMVEEAEEAFNRFLKEALLSGKRALLVVHGRGLSSRNEPVLKAKVKEWLTSGPWRKWVIAFTSAQACDGGAGATYVLLRHHPATSKTRKMSIPGRRDA